MMAKNVISNIKAKPSVKLDLSTILEAFQRMDYHKLNDLLVEGSYYQDVTKTSFIYKQMRLFEEFKSVGDTYLNLSTNICTQCLCNEPVFVFKGNNSGIKYAIYVQYTQDEITDIFKCSEQSE